MNFENTEVFNLEGAIRGMRNPLKSWNKIDSYWDEGFYILGENDLTLARKLIRGGGEHRKFLRQIMVSVDITAPLYLWKELDTYKVGTVANSESTMHKLASTEITFDCFEWDDFDKSDKQRADKILKFWSLQIDYLDHLREQYLETGEKFYWKELIRLLPSSWLQMRTVTMNYENLYNILKQRRGHKLSEWHQVCEWIESLPYTTLLFD